MTQTPNPVTPILDPFLSLLRSRAVLVAILNIVLYVLASQFGATDELLNLISVLGLAIIGKMGLEDAAQKFGASRPAAINAGEVGTVVNQPGATN